MSAWLVPSKSTEKRRVSVFPGGQAQCRLHLPLLMAYRELSSSQEESEDSGPSRSGPGEIWGTLWTPWKSASPPPHAPLRPVSEDLWGPSSPPLQAAGGTSTSESGEGISGTENLKLLFLAARSKPRSQELPRHTALTGDRGAGAGRALPGVAWQGVAVLS